MNEDMKTIDNNTNKTNFIYNITFLGFLSYVVGFGLLFAAFSNAQEYINNSKVLLYLITSFTFVALIGIVILIRISFFKKQFKSILNGLAVFYFLPISILPISELEIDKIFNKEVQNVNAKIINKQVYNHHVFRGGTYQHHVLEFQTDSEIIRTETVLNSYFDTVSLGSNVNIEIGQGFFGFRQIIGFNSK
jgi:hypothetical protein